MDSRYLESLLAQHQGPVHDLQGIEVKLDDLVAARQEKVDALRNYQTNHGSVGCALAFYGPEYKPT